MDISKNREAVKYSKKVLLLRILWGWFGKPMFRFSPRIAFGWRRMILRLFGAVVAPHVNIYPSAVIYFPWNLEIGEWSSIGENALVYNLGKVIIGKAVTISQRSHLCGGTHDYTDPSMPLVKSSIQIGDQAWVCADAFIGPGVKVGLGSIVAARAVVMKDVPAWIVVAGNPSRFINNRNIIK